MKEWILAKVAGLFGPKCVGSTVRTLLAFIGGLLYGIQGIEVEAIQKFLEYAEPVLNGVVLALITWVWSLIQKQKHSD